MLRHSSSSSDGFFQVLSSFFIFFFLFYIIEAILLLFLNYLGFSPGPSAELGYLIYLIAPPVLSVIVTVILTIKGQVIGH